MWPFTKRKLPKSLPLDSPWTVGEGTYDGKPMLARLHMGYKPYGSLPGYAHQVGIAVPLNAPDPRGFPTAEEQQQVDAIEDSLCAVLERNAESLNVAVITTGGMREFVFYTKDPEAVKRHFEELRDRFDTHRIQPMIQPDKGWKVYHQLIA